MTSQLEEFKALEKLVHGVYLVVDPGIVKLLCMTVVSHRLPMDPTWTFLVGASSSGKTEFINCLAKVNGIWPLSSLTANTLISGQKKAANQPTSLLSRLPLNPKTGKTEAIFTFKDFTTVLSMNQDTQAEILGQLREVYDGKYSKEFGTGESKKWEGKVSMFSGTTGSIYKARELWSAMGERFAIYCLLQPNRKEAGRRAIANVSTIREQRPMLQDAFKRFLDEIIVIPAVLPKLPEDMEEEILDLSEMVTRARSIVDRDSKSNTKEIEFAHDPEGIPRFATQLTTYGISLMVINNGPLLATDRDILYKIALDSIDKRRRMILQRMTVYVEVDTKELARDLNYPPNSVRRWCQDLNVLGMVDMLHGGRSDKWVLKPEYKQLISRYDHIQMTAENLEEKLMPDDADALNSAFPGSEVV